MPASVEVSAPQSIDIMMPKKRQQGFDPGASGIPSSTGPTSQPAQSSSSTQQSNSFFGPFGTNGLPSSFIDTDILLNDDLWNQFSPATTTTSSNGASTQQERTDSSAQQQSKDSEHAFGESYVNIPHTTSLDMFGMHSRTFGTLRPTHDALSRLSRDASSMDDGDSPDGSNGETTSTVATSILSPSSVSTTVGSLPKGSGARHHRSSSNASSSNRSKTARSLSLSRSRTRVAAGAAERRGAERSPSLERGGVGKAPSSRARPSRRATVGPAALANNLQANSNQPVPIRAAVGAAGNNVPSSTAMGLSSSFQAQGHRWSLFGTDGSSQNLHLNYNDQTPWSSHTQDNQARPGTTSASSSLPTPLNFHTSMAHLNLQTPPVTSNLHGLPAKAEENQAFNPFLFPPYTQAQGQSGLPNVAQTNTPAGTLEQVRSGDGRSSEASEVSETKPAPAAKPRRTKATSRSRERSTKEVKSEASKTVSPSEANQNEEDDDDDGGDDDDEQSNTGTGAKSEAEAKRLAEKRRKRRESHNAVERRRRDNINEKITELATLLPEAMLLDAIATSTQGGNSGTFAPALAAKAALADAAAAAAKGEAIPDDGRTNLPKSSTEAYAAALAPVHANSAALAAAQAKPNKGIILRKSVEYIRHLQQFLDMQMGRIAFLEAELARSHQALAASGMQAPPTTDPQQGLGMMHAFFDQSSNGNTANPGMFGNPIQQQQQQQQPPQQQHLQQHQPAPQDFSAMNLLSLGMPMEQPQQNTMSMHQNGINMPHSNASSHDATAGAPALAAWLEGFDQRTGLPRRSSVDPIEEEENESDEEDKELSRRGRSQTSKLALNSNDEHWRGRSRHKVGRGSGSGRVQEGSWPDLQPSEAQSPMQLVGAEEQTPASFSDLGEMKLDL